jgi:hypothetical protein
MERISKKSHRGLFKVISRDISGGDEKISDMIASVLAEIRTEHHHNSSPECSPYDHPSGLTLIDICKLELMWKMLF